MNKEYIEWTTERKEILMSMWHTHTRRQIAEEIGTTLRSVSAAATRMGLSPKQPHVPWSPEMIQKLRDIYWSGASYSQITQAMGVTHKSWKNKVEKLGMKRGPVVPRLKVESNNRVVERHATPAPKVSPPETAWLALPGTMPKPLTEHQQHQCKWPIGEQLLFCCAPTEVPYGTYCKAHRTMSLVRVKDLT